MAVPTRPAAVQTLEEGHRAIRRLLAEMSEEELIRPGTIGGGSWSAKDLLGHLTSWEEIALASLHEWRRGERPGIENVFAIEARCYGTRPNTVAGEPEPRWLITPPTMTEPPTGGMASRFAMFSMWMRCACNSNVLVR